MDAIFKALGDETRRKLLDMLRERDGQTLSELEQKLEMTRFGVMKHLKVLEDASLVVSRRSGRLKHHYLNAVPLQQVIDRWIEPLVQKPMSRALLDMKAELEGMDAMSDPKPDFVMETYIRTTRDALWQALTGTEMIARYHFMPVSVTADLQEGGHITQHSPDGSVLLKYEILAMDPPHRLETTFEPGWGENLAASRCVYEIEEVGEQCKLRLMHFEIPAGQEGVADGWAKMISSMKSLLETGQPLSYAA